MMDTVTNGPEKSDIVGALLFDRHKILEFNLDDKRKISMKLKGYVPAKDGKRHVLILSVRSTQGTLDRHRFLLYNMEERTGMFVDLKSITDLESLLQT